jgi:hypothetical protein
MTKIPSTEKTDDFIYRSEIKKGTTLHDAEAPHLLAFEIYTEHRGPFHSMDVTTLRDGLRVDDIEFQSFEHVRQHPNITYLRFRFCDNSNHVSEHDYLLIVILRYLI